jgi:formamidase
MRTLAIAAVQTSPLTGDVAGTWKKFVGQVHAVRSRFADVQMVVFPELYLAAVGELLEETEGHQEQVAVSVPGELTDRLGDLARETGLWLVPGTVYERGEEGLVYNTALVVNPAGELVRTYRKCFPWQPFESTASGREMVVFDVPDVGRIGLAICYDTAFPEIYRQLAWFGAEVILQPTLTSTRDRDLELVLARAHAIVNQVYVVSVNASGPHGLGQSLVVDPEGLVRQQAGGNDEIIVDVLDLDAVTRVHRYGTLGLNRMWAQMDEHGPRLSLPMYGGPYRPRPNSGSPKTN